MPFEKTTSPTSSKLKPLFRKILKISGIFILIIGLIGAFAAYRVDKYLKSNETKIMDDLGFLQDGTLSFESTDISFYKDFPAATITVKNVQVKDSLFDKHQKPTLQVGELHGVLSLKNLLQQNIEIKKVRLENGLINIWTNLNGYNNLKSLRKEQEKETNDSGKRPFWKDLKLNSNQLDIVLKNMEVHIQNAIKNSNIQGKIVHLATILDLEKEILAAKIDLNLAIQELTFKAKNGTFLPNSQVKGLIDFAVKDSILSIQPFDLTVNENSFFANAEINLNGSTSSILSLENKATNMNEISPLLPKNIQKTIAPYKIERPFYSKTTIQTDFQPGDKPIIEVGFKLKNQSVIVHKHPFEKTNLKGRFINRIFDDERKFREGKKRFRVIIDDLNTNHSGFNIQSDNLLVLGTEFSKPQIKVAANISGTATAISDWFENDQFFFNKGTFDLFADINGPLKDMNRIILETDAQLNLHDFSVVYEPANVSFPFSAMTLRKEVGDAFFTLTNSSFVEGHKLFVDGGLKNISALLIEVAQQKVSSEANIVSKKLSWIDFIDFFEEQGLFKKGGEKTEQQKKKSMKATVKGMYANFQPRFSIKIDTLAYFDLLQLDKFQTGLHFEDEHTLVLEKTSFEYDGGMVDFSGKLDISQPHLTPFEFELQTKNLNLQKSLPSINYLNISMLANLETLPENLDLTICHKGILDDGEGLIPNSSTGEVLFTINDGKDLKGKIVYQPDESNEEGKIAASAFGKTKIELEGNPKVFNNFFKTEQFFFKDGEFKVAFDYKGNPGTIQELLTSGDATFTINNSEVFYKPVGVTFPLKDLDLKLNDDRATFDFYVTSDTLQEKIFLKGALNNISELLIGNTGKALTSEIQLVSKKINWGQILDILSAEEKKEREEKTESMKASITGILNTFHPHFHANVDTFIYTDALTFSNVKSGVYLKDSSTLILEETSFEFDDGKILLNGQFELGKKLVTPFYSNIKTNNINLNELVKSLNYLALPSLKNMKKLDGRVSMDFDIEGIIDDNSNRLIGNATSGRIKFDLRDVVVIGLEPLDAISSRIRMEKRFQELRFAPIKGEITIDGQEIEFPQLEIQSNAIHLFMEGTLSYGDLTNMWVSIPINNLRRTNRWIIPEKTGYAAAKRKMHVEVTSDEVGNNQFKFRLTKRKFYRHRGILDQYKKDKKRDRMIRRALRKGKKANLPEALLSED